MVKVASARYEVIAIMMLSLDFTCPQTRSGSGSGSSSKTGVMNCTGRCTELNKSFILILLLCSQTTGVPVIPFIDLGNSGGTLSGVWYTASPVINLPSPLPLGELTVNTAYVSSCLMHTVIS